MALNIALCDDIMGLIGDRVETMRAREISREKMDAVIGHMDTIFVCTDNSMVNSSICVGNNVASQYQRCLIIWAKEPISHLCRWHSLRDLQLLCHTQDIQLSSKFTMSDTSKAMRSELKRKLGEMRESRNTDDRYAYIRTFPDTRFRGTHDQDVTQTPCTLPRSRKCKLFIEREIVSMCAVHDMSASSKCRQWWG